MAHAAAAYEAARNEAEQHGMACERATAQAQRVWVLAFRRRNQGPSSKIIGWWITVGWYNVMNSPTRSGSYSFR